MKLYSIIFIILFYIYSIYGGDEIKFPSLTSTASSLSSGVDIERPILKFPKDRPFKIVQFTDLHYEGLFSGEDLLTQQGQEKILEIENPDFVMLSGDMISGYKSAFVNEEAYKKTWDLFTEPMRKRNIPWAITFGNHDAEGALTGYQMMELDRSYPLSLSQHGPSEAAGNANYVINIQGSNDTAAASYIYIFDSDTPSCGANGAWGCIQPSQIEWFKKQSLLNLQIPSIAFVHVPPIEVVDLWNNFPVYGDFGDMESSCFYTHKYKFVDSLLEQGDIKGLYFGHDHKNDFIGDYKGLSMGYGRKTGYGSYNPKYQQGARVLLIDENPYLITSYIRNNLGEIDQQKLHLPDNQLKAPLHCSKPGDGENEDWQMYLVVFVIVSVFVMFVQYRRTNKKYMPINRPAEMA
ncbi:hypothetical protein CYY_004342 [Polysphondylium violaceum]|uniref:Calcineurin-like phosphoesterase domain-containing protein n=1 Tax=Polysphondylium violaceum TaxID=133409 RepID=A0A8J4PWX0_9MYCE|nr:hypothetical protein CYY_004342 [Polysphondylium violaceum]